MASWNIHHVVQWFSQKLPWVRTFPSLPWFTTPDKFDGQMWGMAARNPTYPSDSMDGYGWMDFNPLTVATQRLRASGKKPMRSHGPRNWTVPAVTFVNSSTEVSRCHGSLGFGWKLGPSGTPSRHHACFNTRSWSNDLDDLGLPPWLDGHLYLGFVWKCGIKMN